MTMTELEHPDAVWLQRKADWVRTQTLLIHARAQETRVASSLSAIELFVALYYGGWAATFPQDPHHPARDRIIASKGHGSICVYPILADLGYFDPSALNTVCKPGSFLGGIPDPIIPGYETINGSLGHGLGVGAGMALALRARHEAHRVYVVLGDGELNEGSVWEAIMFAGQQRLKNLVAIVDCNGRSMLGYTEDIIDLAPLEQKFAAFGWATEVVSDGHSMAALQAAFASALSQPGNQPVAIIAHTVKGKGVPALEQAPLAHVMNVPCAEIERITGTVSKESR